MQRPNPSYPIWDNNTTTTIVADADTDVDITVPAGAYYMIFSTNAGFSGAGRIFIRDDTATTASTGIQVEDAAPGTQNYEVHVAPGAVIRVTRPASSGFFYTTFFNKIS